MTVVLAILGVYPDGNAALVAWFPSQVAFNRWFSRWSKRGGGVIPAEDLREAGAAVKAENGRTIRMGLDYFLETLATASIGKACLVRLTFNQGTKVADGKVTIDHLIVSPATTAAPTSPAPKK